MTFAEHDGDVARLAVAHRAKGYTAFFLGRYAEAERTLRRGVELAESGIPAERFAIYGEHPGILCRLYRGWALAPLGRAPEAVAVTSQGIVLARALRNPHALAWALACAALVHVFLRDLRTTGAYAEESLALAVNHRLPQWRAWSTFFAGWARTETAEPAAGLEMMEEGARAWRATGAVLSTTLLRGLLAEGHARHGDRARAREHLNDAFAHHHDFQEAYMLAELHRIEALICRLEDRPQDVIRDALVKANEVARDQGAIAFGLRAACDHAAFERAEGQAQRARAMLATMLAAAPADCPDLAKARTLMSELTP